MDEKEQIVARMIEVIGEADGDLTSEGLVDADPKLFRAARMAFGSWEDALVASLVHACQGSRKRRVSTKAVQAEAHHERTRADGWDGAVILATEDGVILQIAGHQLPTVTSGPIEPQPFMPRGEQVGIRAVVSNPNIEPMMVVTDSGVGYPLDPRMVHDISGPPRKASEMLGCGGEQVESMLVWSRVTSTSRFVHATSGGKIKASSARDFGRILDRDGVQALLLAEGDGVCTAFVQTDAHPAIFCANAKGNGIHFKVGDIRTMGLRAQGVKSMDLGDFDAVIGAAPVRGDEQILVISAGGVGKRVPLVQFRMQGRAGQGMILMRPDKDGDELATMAVLDGLDDDVLIWTVGGRMVRAAASAFPLLDRSNKGKAVLSIPSGDRIAGVCRLPGAG